MRDRSPSARPGMGSILYPGGATFRVWAPNAASVAVAGSFNNWSKQTNPLAAEGNGYWSTDVAGAQPGHGYKYVIVHASTELNPWRPDPYGQAMATSIGHTLLYDPDFDWGSGSFRMPGWDELVIYELHIGTYSDEQGGGPGRLTSVVGRLDHLVELGVNAIQLLPPAEFPGGFSWGYNPSSIFTVETDYGGPDALKRLIRAAHERGLAVICDVVYNHFGTGDAALWRFDGWHRGDKGGIYYYSDWRDLTPWGHTRPDYGRPEVRQFLRDNALLWLEEYRFDGLRWDATSYIRNVHGGGDPGADLPDGWELMRWINDEIDSRQPWKLSIAEDMQNNEWITRPTGAGGAGFDTQWDAGFLHPVRQALTRTWDQDRDLDAVADAIQHRYNGDALQRVVYTESHDEVATSNGKRRLPEDIDPGHAGSWYARKRSTLGAVLVFTVPGIPMIFQGQELLEDGSWHDDDPVDWSKQARNAGIVQLYRDLIALRRNRDSTTGGLRGQHAHVHHLNDTDKVLAFHRFAGGGPRDSVVVVVNLANRGYARYTIGMPRAGRWRVRFNSDWAGYDPGFGHQDSFDTVTRPGGMDSMPYAADIGLGPYSAVILSQDD
jgi:1,4-alpha-glucan branching enzyme